ncbi:hypothetical protein Apa02nite_066690 [Actinoplanes palleronii]|uniref:Uncharacterized protein n=1 Tax=Actinoplanes palleronii TaxID=113570 RepID=A0ABQ4BIQ6_9ACTN|nr:hypothetical protein Apa02nite_066690 [Actinoplanes palleronii]
MSGADSGPLVGIASIGATPLAGATAGVPDYRPRAGRRPGVPAQLHPRSHRPGRAVKFDTTPAPLRSTVSGPVLARLRLLSLPDFVRDPHSTFDRRRIHDGEIRRAWLSRGQIDGANPALQAVIDGANPAPRPVIDGAGPPRPRPGPDPGQHPGPGPAPYCRGGADPDSPNTAARRPLCAQRCRPDSFL